jgi:hypothetical protein
MEQEDGLKTKYSSPTVIWTVRGKSELDYPGIWFTKVKIGVTGNIFCAELKYLEAEKK